MPRIASSERIFCERHRRFLGFRLRGSLSFIGVPTSCAAPGSSPRSHLGGCTRCHFSFGGCHAASHRPHFHLPDSCSTASRRTPESPPPPNPKHITPRIVSSSHFFRVQPHFFRVYARHCLSFQFVSRRRQPTPAIPLQDPSWELDINYQSVVWKWFSRFQAQNAMVGLGWQVRHGRGRSFPARRLMDNPRGKRSPPCFPETRNHRERVSVTGLHSFAQGWSSCMLVLAAVLLSLLGGLAYLGQATRVTGLSQRQQHSRVVLQAIRLSLSFLLGLFYVSTLQTFIVPVSCWVRRPYPRAPPIPTLCLHSCGESPAASPDRRRARASATAATSTSPSVCALHPLTSASPWWASA